MFCAMALVAMIAGSASAGVIAEWDFYAEKLVDDTQDGRVSGDTELPVTAVNMHTDIASAALDIGPSLKVKGNQGGTDYSRCTRIDQDTIGEAWSDGDYWKMTISPAAGMQMDFDGVQINMCSEKEWIEFDMALYSSETGTSAGDELATWTQDDWDLANYTMTDSTRALSLSGVDAAIEFYFVVSARNANGNGSWSQYDNLGFGSGSAPAEDVIDPDVVFTGDVVVPEPATLSLLGLGGLVALRRRRRA
jgi:hypothetical protein